MTSAPCYLLLACVGFFSVNCDDTFAKEGLDMHNRLPERRGNPYKLDSRLCREAQSYANTLARRDIDGGEHANQHGDGENLAWQSPLRFRSGYNKPSAKPSAAVVVKDWYNEKYPWVDQYTADGTNHYTQAVWADSKHMCMATAQSNSGAWFTVARYHPRGNLSINGRNQRYKQVKDQHARVGDQVYCGGHWADSCADCGNRNDCNGQCTWKLGVGKPDVCY